MEYPRVYGDNKIVSCRSKRDCGIPPCVRGQHNRRYRAFFSRGNTPVCTGITFLCRKVRCLHREYPRVHGDNLEFWRATSSGPGIPPLSRGQREPWTIHRPPYRNTPGCTGTTSVGVALQRVSKEYPRVYGDNGCRLYPVGYLPGIPPCVRGRRRPHRQLGPQRRNTPVCMGTT